MLILAKMGSADGYSNIPPESEEKGREQKMRQQKRVARRDKKFHIQLVKLSPKPAQASGGSEVSHLQNRGDSNIVPQWTTLCAAGLLPLDVNI